MVDFEDAYSAWREEPFPLGSRLNALDEVHADLVLVDTWVAETIIPFVEAGRYHPAEVDVLGKPQGIRHRASEFETSEGSDEERLAAQYVTYADLLRTVYERFLKKIADTGQRP
jgi:hypothetical protein